MNDIGFAGSWDDILLALAAIVAAAALIWRNVIRPLGQLLHTVAQLNETLLDIAHEFAPNAGPSLKDRIEHIDDRIEHIDAFVVRHRVEHEELTRQLQILAEEQERVVRRRRRRPSAPPPDETA